MVSPTSVSAQAEALRWRLAADDDLRPDAVLVSTMRRAVQTAEIIAEPTGLVPEQHADLMERTSGEAEGLTIAEYTDGVRQGAVDRLGRTRCRRVGSRARSSVPVCCRRPIAWWTTHRGKTVWVVCHGGVIMVSAIRRWPGASADLTSLPAASPANTSISEWHVDDGRQLAAWPGTTTTPTWSGSWAAGPTRPPPRSDRRLHGRCAGDGAGQVSSQASTISRRCGQAAANPAWSGRRSTSSSVNQPTASVSKLIEEPNRSSTSTTMVV